MPPHVPPADVLSSGPATLRFFESDCLTLFETLPAGSVDVIVTSPPYNLGVAYRSYGDSLPRDAYLEWTGRWIVAAARVLGADGSLFLNVGSKPTDPWAALDVAQVARTHLTLQNTIHWVKSIALERDAVGGNRLDKDLAVGHYKPLNSPRFLNDCHEYVFHFTPAGDTPLDRRAIGVAYQDASNIARWQSSGSGRRCRGNTWFVPYDTIQSRTRERPHPATFPTRLPEMCLKLHGLSRINLAIDPFLGLGNTAVACARLGLNFIGVEIDSAYLAEAVERTRLACLSATDEDADGQDGIRAAPRA